MAGVPGERRAGFEERGGDGAQAEGGEGPLTGRERAERPGSRSVRGEVTRLVKVTLSARRDGTAIEAAGSLPVAFSDFRVIGPGGYGFLGSLAGHGTAEFLLILRLR